MTDYTQELIETANKIATAGKGILAADESTGTIGKRFDNISVENNVENRQVRPLPAAGGKRCAPRRWRRADATSGLPVVRCPCARDMHAARRQQEAAVAAARCARASFFLFPSPLPSLSLSRRTASSS